MDDEGRVLQRPGLRLRPGGGDRLLLEVDPGEPAPREGPGHEVHRVPLTAADVDDVDSGAQPVDLPGEGQDDVDEQRVLDRADRKSTRLNSSHVAISYAVFCLKKKKSKHKQ